MLQQIIKEAYNMMFNKIKPSGKYKIHGSYLKIGITKLRTTIAVMNNGNKIGKVKLTFLEQNPNKDSTYGKAARKGNKIMWVISNYKEKEKWLGRIENNKWIKK